MLRIVIPRPRGKVTHVTQTLPTEASVVDVLNDRIKKNSKRLTDLEGQGVERLAIRVAALEDQLVSLQQDMVEKRRGLAYAAYQFALSLLDGETIPEQLGKPAIHDLSSRH